MYPILEQHYTIVTTAAIHSVYLCFIAVISLGSKLDFFEYPFDNMFRSSHSESVSTDESISFDLTPQSNVHPVGMQTNMHKKEKYRIKKMLYIASIGLFFNISAYYGLINLQSSLNIRDGLGTTGLAIGYVSSLVWALLLTPLAIEYLGPKNSMVVSEVTYVIYCVANFYPNYFTLIPGAIVLGFGEACCWASMSVIVTYYGERYWSLTVISSQNPHLRQKPLPLAGEVTTDTIYGAVMGTDKWSKLHTNQQNGGKNKDVYVSMFFSRYFSVIKTSQIVGNLLSYVALFAGVVATDNGSAGLDVTGGNLSHAGAVDVKNKTALDLSLCGINDCVADFQMASPEMLSRYLAKSQMSVSVLLAVFVVMHAIAIAMHFFLLDPIPKQRPTLGADGIEIDLLNDSSTNRKCSGKILATLVALFRQMFSMQQILVSPIALYFGLFLSYGLSEFTRAFVSCTMGVESVGLVMMLFGASSMVAAFLLGKVVPKFGRNPLYLLASLIDLACYGSNFLWIPSIDNTLPVYFMAIGFGFNAGLWEPLINSTYAFYFADNTSAAFSLWNFWGAAGLCVGFSLSTTVCLAVKLYILISLLAVSMICYVFAEVRNRNMANVNPM